MSVTVERAPPRSPEAIALLEALNADLTGPYRPEQHHYLSPEELERSGIRFFVARIDGRPVGCGGVELFDDYAEVKRMFTLQSARRAGVGRALLRQLEEEAGKAGLALLRLETGCYQTAAMRLYERMGFVQRGPFGRYSDLPPQAIETSVFYEKPIP